MYPLAKKNLLNKQAIKIETRNKQNNNIVKLFFYIFLKIVNFHKVTVHECSFKCQQFPHSKIFWS